MKILYIMFLLFSSTAHAEVSFYEVLGVESTASSSQIKAAYKKLAIAYHPDRNGGDPEATEKFKKVAEAFEVLSDTMKRQAYDLGVRNFRGFDERDIQRQASEIKKINERYSKLSNEHWQYDQKSQTFFDRRTNLKSELLKTNAIFKTVEGWSFSPYDGSYSSNFSGATWDPSTGEGWKMYNSSAQEYISIDIKTGFPKAFEYRVTTRSDASVLFDQWLNPSHHQEFDHWLKSSHSQDGTAKKLESAMSQLSWTESQRVDFEARVRARIKFFSYSEVGKYSNGIVRDKLVQSFLSHDSIRNFPELLVDILKAPIPFSSAEYVSEVLSQEGWLRDKKLEPVYKQAVTNNEIRGQLLYKNTMGEQTLDYTKLRLLWPYITHKPSYDHMKVLILTMTMLQFGSNNTQAKTPALDNLAYEMIKVAYSDSFIRMIASTTADSIEHIEKFLDWFSQHDSEVASTFKKALKIRDGRDRYVTSKETRALMEKQTIEKRMSIIEPMLDKIKCQRLESNAIQNGLIILR